MLSGWSIVLLIVVVLYIILAFYGNRTYHSSVSITVDVPLKPAFKIAMDDSHMKEWLSSPMMQFENIENISGGAHEVGSKWKMTFVDRKNKRMEMVETVTDYVENEHFGMDLEDKMFNTHVDMRFEADGDKTIITESSSVKGKNLMTGAMMAIFSGQSLKIKQQMYTKLQEVIEREYEE